MIKGTIKRLVAVNLAAVYLLYLGPDFLDPSSRQVGSSGYIPYGLYGYFWSDNQVRDYLCPMNLRVVPKHRQLGSIRGLHSYLLEGVGNVLGIETAHTKVPVDHASSGGDATEDHDGLGAIPTRVLSDRLLHWSPVPLDIGVH